MNAQVGGVPAILGRLAVAGIRFEISDGAEPQFRVTEGMTSNERGVREIRTPRFDER